MTKNKKKYIMIKQNWRLLLGLVIILNLNVLHGDQILSNIDWSKELPLDSISMINSKTVINLNKKSSTILENRRALQAELLNYLKSLLKQENISSLQEHQVVQIIDYFRWSDYQEGLFYFADYTSKLNRKYSLIYPLMCGKGQLYVPMFQHIKDKSKVKFNKNMAMLWLALNNELNNTNEYARLVKETKNPDTQIRFVILFLFDSRASNLIEDVLISCSPDTSNSCYKVLEELPEFEYVDNVKTLEYDILFSYLENWYSKKRIKCNP